MADGVILEPIADGPEFAVDHKIRKPTGERTDAEREGVRLTAKHMHQMGYAHPFGRCTSSQHRQVRCSQD